MTICSRRYLAAIMGGSCLALLAPTALVLVFSGSREFALACTYLLSFVSLSVALLPLTQRHEMTMSQHAVYNKDNNSSSKTLMKVAIAKMGTESLTGYPPPNVVFTEDKGASAFFEPATREIQLGTSFSEWYGPGFVGVAAHELGHYLQVLSSSKMRVAIRLSRGMFWASWLLFAISTIQLLCGMSPTCALTGTCIFLFLSRCFMLMYEVDATHRGKELLGNVLNGEEIRTAMAAMDSSLITYKMAAMLSVVLTGIAFVSLFA